MKYILKTAHIINKCQRARISAQSIGFCILGVISHGIKVSQSSRMFCEKGVLKISQNSQENTSATVSYFNKVGEQLRWLLLKHHSYDYFTDMTGMAQSEYLQEKYRKFQKPYSLGRYFFWLLESRSEESY